MKTVPRFPLPGVGARVEVLLTEGAWAGQNVWAPVTVTRRCTPFGVCYAHGSAGGGMFLAAEDEGRTWRRLGAVSQ